MCNSRALSRICDVSYFKLQLISQVNFFEKKNFKGALAPKQSENHREQPTTYIPISAKNIFRLNLLGIPSPFENLK